MDHPTGCVNRVWPGYLLTIFLAVVLLVNAGSSAPPPAAGEATPLATATRQAWDLAGEGKLDEALGQVKGLTVDAKAGTPMAALARDLSEREAHVSESRAKAHARYEKLYAKLNEQVKAEKLTDALISATRAHDMADDPRALLGDPVVADLVARSEKRAAEQEKAGKLLQALDLYSGLGALFRNENRDKYSEPLRRIASRVGLVRLYAPKVFHDLAVKKAQEEGEKDLPPWNAEDDEWHDQVAGITFGMLGEALALAAENHVESTGYEPLMKGGVESLRVLISTQGLEGTFPTLGDAEKVKMFSEALDALDKEIAGHNGAIGAPEAEKMLEQLRQENQKTIALPEEVVAHEFGDGATGKLDEFSGYIWPHAKSRFDRTTTQKFSGVGIQISQVDRQITVVTPLEDTPAHRAGIRPGDRIVTIDGKNTLGMDLDVAVDRITGTEGTQVCLGIQSPGMKEPRSVTLTRTSIKIVSIKGWSRGKGGSWDYYIDPALKIGYVRMTSFGPDTADELDAAVASMKDGVNGLILDLRFNPGGRLDAAIHVGDRFLDEGVIVSTTQKLITGQPWVARASRAHTYPPFPVIVLVNHGSASASEIVSGALKDHKRALIVGQRSFGKGSVQNLFPIGDKSAYMKLTTQYYRLPSGKIIHRRPGSQEWGVEPDVEVRMTDRQTASSLQARTLLDILKEDGEKVDPKSVISTRAVDDDEEDPLPQVNNANDVLKLGLDPQLETAVLLLKTRVLGEGRG